MDNQPVLSVILPCLNEEAGLAFCLPKIHSFLADMNVPAEVIVVDNGSLDASVSVAEKNSAQVIREPLAGYGAACMKGLSEAKGKYLFFADADGSYDFAEMPRFLEALQNGADFVIGNRFKGTLEKGAMPWLNCYIGNPVLSFVLRTFFKSNIHDIHCGMRAIRKEAFQSLSLATTGMEFASEMIVMVLKKGLRVAELPIHYYKRKGKSKLKRFSDGWRHLRFMLLYKPFVLFFLPGLVLFTAGAVSLPLFYFNSISLFRIRFFYHPMFLSSLAMITGYQLVIFSLFAKTYAINHLGDKPVLERFYLYFNLERACVVGGLAVFLGGAVYLQIFAKWLSTHFGALNEVKNAVLGLTLIVLGVQTVFSAFMLSILGIKQK